MGVVRVRRVVFSVVATAGLAFGAFVGAAPVGAQEESFGCGDHTWTVPEGVTTVTAEVYGAAGGGGWQAFIADAFVPGGLGGYSAATLEVTPGEQLVIVVGCEGDTPSTTEFPTTNVGGAPNGGDGGTANFLAGGGGGASFIHREDGSPHGLLLGAGGGGGGGANNNDLEFANPGGDGGGCDGTAGVNVGGGGSGGAGTATAPGAGGAGFGPLGNPGQDGAVTAGGAGGSADENAATNAGGGGGGGAPYGGGGGGSSEPQGEGEFQAGGGGGGGGGTGPTGYLCAAGVQAGDGLVIITPGDAVVPTPPQPVQAAPRFTG